MGLTKCKECGKEVSVDANICPHCGESFPGLSISCPKCGSTKITTDKRGFSFGQAAGGGLILGPLGLLLGAAGRKDTVLCCQACGHRWETQEKAAQNKETQVGCLVIIVLCAVIYLLITIVPLIPPYIRTISSDLSSCIKKSSLEKKEKIYNKKVEKFLGKKPKSAEDYELRGSIFLTQGNLDQAIIEYNKSIEISPDGYYRSYEGRGMAFYKKGNFDKSISDCSRAIEINPNASEVYFLRGGVYNEKKEYDKALQDMLKAKSLGYDVPLDLLDNLKKLITLNQGASAVSENSQSAVVLGGVFLDPNGKSSAIINGKVVFEGDNVSGIIVDKINKDSVDIVVNGEKNNIRIK